MAVPDLATVAEAELADLEQLWQSLDLPGHRVELVDGQIVVSPSPSRRHAHAVTELIDQLIEAKRRGWQRDTNLTVHMSGTRERLVPDLIVAPADAPGFGDDEVLSTGVLLVAEVVSPSSRRQDRETKNRAYAQGRIPLYLLIDRFAEPPAVTLFSEPAEAGYRRSQTAAAGERLRIPEPFGISLDTARLLG
jgi:Uma2 family endonuclease